jgi:hypothetical protein
VLFGVKPWNDQVVRNSLQVGDSTSAYPLAVDTPSGRVWHRFTFDGYGEQANGDDWDLFFDDPARQTRGRLWPLLSGERGEYELAAGNDARPFLRTIANTANDGLMLPSRCGTTSRRRARSRAGNALVRSARVDARAVHPAGVGRSTRASRSSGRRSSPAATPASIAPGPAGRPLGARRRDRAGPRLRCLCQRS